MYLAFKVWRNCAIYFQQPWLFRVNWTFHTGEKYRLLFHGEHTNNRLKACLHGGGGPQVTPGR